MLPLCIPIFSMFYPIDDNLPTFYLEKNAVVTHSQSVFGRKISKLLNIFTQTLLKT